MRERDTLPSAGENRRPGGEKAAARGSDLPEGRLKLAAGAADASRGHNRAACCTAIGCLPCRTLLSWTGCTIVSCCANSL